MPRFSIRYPFFIVVVSLIVCVVPLRGAHLQTPTRLDSVGHISRIPSPTEVAHYQIRRVIDIYVKPKGEAVNKLYLILAAQFKSFVDPFLILLAIPTGLAGVLLALWLTGTTLNIMSLMGVIMMAGIVVSNSILIVEFANRMREEGRTIAEAVTYACRVRLRPILMTSLATVIGLLPMALKLGTGSETYAPLARVIIGGLTLSVILTVFIVPAAYVLVYRSQEATVEPGDS